MPKPKLIDSLAAKDAARLTPRNWGKKTHTAYAVASPDTPVKDGTEIGFGRASPAGDVLIQLGSLPKNGMIVLRPVI